MEDLARIVVPVDLEQHTQKIVDFAIYMANKLNSEIILFHCVEFVESAAMGEIALSQFSFEDFNSSHAKHAEEVLGDMIKNAGDKCKKCRSKVVIGDTVESILQYAESEKADMIIIGTHGKRGLEKILLGSVAERVLKRAHCPVLVTNPYR